MSYKPYGVHYRGGGGGRLGGRLAAARRRPALLLGFAVGLLISSHMLFGWPLGPSARKHDVSLRDRSTLLPGGGGGGAAAAAAESSSSKAGAGAGAGAAAAGASGGGSPAPYNTTSTAPITAATGAAAAAEAAAAAAAAKAAAAETAAPVEEWRERAAKIPFTMVTGASSNYFRGLHNFVGSLHYWCPKCRIAIYDLGLTPVSFPAAPMQRPCSAHGAPMRACGCMQQQSAQAAAHLVSN
jgi:hypothetical protein